MINRFYTFGALILTHLFCPGSENDKFVQALHWFDKTILCEWSRSPFCSWRFYQADKYCMVNPILYSHQCKLFHQLCTQCHRYNIYIFHIHHCLYFCKLFHIEFFCHFQFESQLLPQYIPLEYRCQNSLYYAIICTLWMFYNG